MRYINIVVIIAISVQLAGISLASAQDVYVCDTRKGMQIYIDPDSLSKIPPYKAYDSRGNFKGYELAIGRCVIVSNTVSHVYSWTFLYNPYQDLVFATWYENGKIIDIMPLDNPNEPLWKMYQFSIDHLGR